MARELASLTSVARFRFRLGVICALSLVLILALLRGFFSGFSSFPPAKKTNTLNSNSTRVKDLYENQLRLMWLPL